MSFWLSLLNDIAVSLFGSILSASFSGALADRRNRRIFWGCMALIPLLQGIVYFFWDAVFLQRVYPLVVHLPLVLILYLLTGTLLWPVISVLSAYLVFLLYHSDRERKHSQLEQVQKNLHLQLTQAVREISSLRESQAMARRYRHDLRHHLQYLSACIENGQTEQAQAYITGICAEIEAQRVLRYCENETANLILSAFAGRAERDGTRLHVHGALPAHIHISDSDLCVLLSNALENALNACRALAADGADCRIDVQLYKRGGKLFLQVTNPCGDDVRFENSLPVTDRPGHGVGVRSICAIVEQYGGVCAFLVREGQFILRLSL